MPKNNTIIHKSFSKKDLLKIIDEFKIPIGVSESHTKLCVATTLWNILVNMQYLEIPENNPYLVKDIQSLRSFLKNPNPRKPFSVKDRDRYILTAKKINHYCENGYQLEKSLYTDIKDIYNDADEISKYGDIPIVRKTIKKLMQDVNRLYTIKPIISPHIQHDIELKKSLSKRTSHYKCKVKYGKFIISFD